MCDVGFDDYSWSMFLKWLCKCLLLFYLFMFNVFCGVYANFVDKLLVCLESDRLSLIAYMH